MKKLLIFSAAVIIAGATLAQSPAPSPRKKTSASFVAPQRPKGAPSPTGSATPFPKAEPQGAIPRALRGGNPLQMLNPKAPAKYGTAAQSVLIDPDTGKWRGIKLFEIIF
jgi:hypothetical protein